MEGQGDYGYDGLPVPVMHHPVAQENPVVMRLTCPFAGCGDYAGYFLLNHIREAHRAAAGAVLLVQEATVTLHRTTLLRVPLHPGPPVFLQLSGRDNGDIALQSVGARPMADGRTLRFTVVIPGPGPCELTFSSAVPCTHGRVQLVPVTPLYWSSSGSLSFTIVVHVHEETEPPADDVVEAIEALSVK